MNSLTYIEIIIILILICIQINQFIKTKNLISKLRKTFPAKLQDIEDLKTITHSLNKSTYIDIYNLEKIVDSDYKNLLNDINNHIIVNKGVSDFSLIKEIIESEIHYRDEQIKNTISTPLYIGLMGTMVGIIVGLMTFQSSDSVDVTENIPHLLSGVVVAMFSSLIGLLLTVYNSGRIYKKAFKEVGEGKRYLYNNIRMKLLPLLPGLDTSLRILDNNLSTFNEIFRENIVIFGKEMSNVSENLHDQKEILDQIKRINITQLAESNVKIIEVLGQSSIQISKFDYYLKNINQFIENSNKLVEISNKFYEKLANLDTRVEDVAKYIHGQLESYNQLLKSLERYFNELRERKEFTEEIISSVDMTLKKSTSDLISHSQNYLDEWKNNVTNVDIVMQKNLRELLEHTKKSMEEIEKISDNYNNYINKISTNNIPDFNKLEYLEKVYLEIKGLSDLYKINFEKKSNITGVPTKNNLNVETENPKNLTKFNGVDENIFHFEESNTDIEINKSKSSIEIKNEETEINEKLKEIGEKFNIKTNDTNEDEIINIEKTNKSIKVNNKIPEIIKPNYEQEILKKEKVGFWKKLLGKNKNVD